MTLKAIPHGDTLAVVFDKHLKEKLKITHSTEFDYRTDGTRLILYPLETQEEQAEVCIV